MTNGSHSSRIGLVLDCVEPDRLARFWSEALGYTTVGTAGAYVALCPPPGRAGPKLLLQRVVEPKTVKNRMHFDIDCRDIENEAARLVALGATRTTAEKRHEHGSSWVLMADPEGNEFCVCDGGNATGGSDI